MRISDFENEQALDLLADIMEPASVIMGDEKVQKMVKNKKPALSIAPYILRNFKPQSIEIVSRLHGKKPGDFKFNAITLLNDVLDILNDPEVQILFTSQGQNDTSSGSATENTGEDR